MVSISRRSFGFGVAATTFAFAGIPRLSMAQTPSGILAVGQIAEPKSLDPQAVTAVNDFRILVNLYEGLVRYKPGTLEVEPALAESWEISEDGKQYTFKLRQGVKFHDDSDFNAEAVKFTFDRMLKKDHKYHDTGPFPLSFFFSSVDETVVIDDHTVRFLLKEPYAPFLSNLAYPTGLIVSPKSVMDHGKEFGRYPAGTGPFKFVEWEANQKVVIDKHEAYWGEKAGLTAIIFRPITDANTRVAEMLSGGIDMMVEVPPDSLSSFRTDDYRIAERDGPHLWFLILNMKEGPFKDKKLRQAANYAINKEALCNKVLEGTANVAAGPTPPAFKWAYNNDIEPYPYDLEKAKALIAESGVTDLSVTFYVTEEGSGMLDPVPMGTAIQADLKAAGFDVKIETYEWNTFLGKVNPGLEGKADMAEMAWMTNDPDTLPYLALRTAAWPDQGGFNSGYYSNRQVDKLLDEARRSTDQDKRGDLYKKMQAIVHDDAPWVFVANWKQNAVTSKAVSGFELQPSFLLNLNGVEKA